jgi:hypothetical protein
MVRTQIQITNEQARALKKLAAKEGKSMAELIRISVDEMIRRGGFMDWDEVRRKAILSAGKIKGPEDLSADHDEYLAEAFDQ